MGLEKSLTTPRFDWLVEIKNVYVYIPLIQEIKNISIYAKIIKELCISKLGRKPKDRVTIHVVGKLVYLMMGKPLATKYGGLGIPTIILQINQKGISNTLVDLFSTINIMTKETLEQLSLPNFRPTPTILELEDCYTIRRKGKALLY